MKTIKDAGVPIESAAAKLAVLTGEPVEECEADLRESMRKLVMPSKAAREEAERLGIDFSTAASLPRLRGKSDYAILDDAAFGEAKS